MGEKLGFDLAEFRNIPLPSESEIMADWKGEVEHPVVSVLCITYNQDIYIEDAIRGFLIQKTGFPFEVIIHDDASTDGNPEIIKRYADKYPKIVKPVIQEVNQYSQGEKLSVLSFQHAKGRYVAFCEGDDFWICNKKLHIEVEAASSSGCSLVFTSALMLRNEKIAGRAGKCQDKSGIVSLKSVIFGGGSYCPTPSLLVKREVMEVLSRENWFLSAPVGDLYIQAFAAIENGAYYVDRDTCVYRVQARGSWSSAIRSVEQEKNSLKKQVDSIASMANYFNKDRDELSNQMISRAYYVSAIRFLKIKEFSIYAKLMAESWKYVKQQSKGYRIFYFLRRYPKLAYQLMKILPF